MEESKYLKDIKNQTDQLQRQQLEFDKHVNALPDGQKHVIKSQIEIVNKSIDVLNDHYFDFSVDTFLMENGLPGNERDNLLYLAKRNKTSGKVFVIAGVPLIVMPTGNIIHVDKYIYLLEKCLINKPIPQEKSSQKTWIRKLYDYFR